MKSQFEGCSSVLLLMVAWMRETRAQNPRNYVEEANLVESIAGRMRTDDAYSLQSPLPVVQAEQSEDSIGVPMAVGFLQILSCPKPTFKPVCFPSLVYF